MDEIEIEVVELEFLEACLEGRFDALGPMIGVPEFRGDKYILPLGLPCLEHLLHGFADLFLGPVTFRSVERAKPCLKRCLGRILGCDGVGESAFQSRAPGLRPLRG
jgi:hypothetical protein